MSAKVDLNPESIISGLNMSEFETGLMNEFVAQAQGTMNDLDEKYRPALIDLAERAGKAYLKKAKLAYAGEEVPPELKEQLALYKAELAQYEGIAALEFDAQLEKAAKIALAIVAAAVIKAIISQLAL